LLVDAEKMVLPGSICLAAQGVQSTCHAKLLMNVEILAPV
jgi:hypothetical protein